MKQAEALTKLREHQRQLRQLGIEHLYLFGSTRANADIVEAIEHIKSETLDDFERDWRKRWLVERGVEIISEASRHLSEELKARHPEIPWPKVQESATC